MPLMLIIFALRRHFSFDFDADIVPLSSDDAAFHSDFCRFIFHTFHC